MKRFLLLFCTVILFCTLIIVPTFAAEVYSVDVDGGGGVIDSVAADTYIVQFSTPDVAVTFTDPFEVPDNNGEYLDAISGFLTTDEGVSGFAIDYSIEFIVYEDGLFHSEIFFDVTYNGSQYEGDGTVILTSTSYVPPVPDLPSETAEQSILSVFSGLMPWIASSFNGVLPVFWNATGLTFLGVLSVCALALAVVLLIIFGVVQFLRFRG